MLSVKKNPELPEYYMRMAIDLACGALGRTTPNPPVGAVIVHDGHIVGQGFHPKAGEPHAEVFALREAGENALGADIYVTLEPCSHHGRTPPCCEALIAAGVARVFVGMVDPNPRVSGEGISRLRAAGIDVHVGVLEKECRRLVAPFVMHTTSGRPLFILKSALTLDGHTATRSGHSQWITNSVSRQHVHQVRDRVDAIMVGSGTALRDNPRLTTRLNPPGRDPVRIVVDSRLRISLDSHLVRHDSCSPTWIVTVETADEEKIAAFKHFAGVEVLKIAATAEGQVDLPALAQCLGQRGVQSVLVEGGSTFNNSLFRVGLIDRVMIYMAPKLLGGNDGYGLFSGKGVDSLDDCLHLDDFRVTTLGEDILLEGEVASCLPD
nr:bifunctional diaminohydroxyphosphoribosylaminopyrimidine deaminase/5-amino-6-(5-phosphoribosylamino)uracil reductase RibD [uncultured Desulfuromonas sp.]